jgi:hypothetical protein
MPVCTEVDFDCYQDVCISNTEIVKQLDRKDALEIIEGLIKKFPDLITDFFSKAKTDEISKIFPKTLKSELIAKFQKEHKSIIQFIKKV